MRLVLGIKATRIETFQPQEGLTQFFFLLSAFCFFAAIAFCGLLRRQRGGGYVRHPWPGLVSTGHEIHSRR